MVAHGFVQPLRNRDIEGAWQPQRCRLGALARMISEDVAQLDRASEDRRPRDQCPQHNRSRRRPGSCGATGGSGAVAALTMDPGRVVTREQLLAELPGCEDNDTHALETGAAQLSSALAAPRVIQTVVKRGYRLAIDPAAARE
jgi:uroporphyrinogen-III synthase